MIEEEPVSSVVTVNIEPSSPQASSIQTSDVFKDQTQFISQTDRSDKTSEQHGQEKQAETVSVRSENPDQSELSVSKSDDIEKDSAQSEELLQTPKVTFITGSDTEDENDMITDTPDIDSVDPSSMNLEPTDSFNVNIDTDLAALAADVLTGQSDKQEEEDDKKKD